MTCNEHQQMVADAILFERAAGALERQMPRELMTDPTAHAVYHFLKGAARQLRKEAGQPLLGDSEAELSAQREHARQVLAGVPKTPWSDPAYPHVKRDINENWRRT